MTRAFYHPGGSDQRQQVKTLEVSFRGAPNKEKAGSNPPSLDADSKEIDIHR